MTRYFDNIRIVPWKPKFTWTGTAEMSANLINKPHEDYPDRVNWTLEVINKWIESHSSMKAATDAVVKIDNNQIRNIHRHIFQDVGFQGKWRETEVVVGKLHRPPEHDKIEKYMNELFNRHNITTIDDLKDWYSDFQTIHPFLDGNGRVGGVILTITARFLEPNKGWLAPSQ